MSDDLSKDVLARLNRLEMFAGHVADWAGNPILHIKARAMLEATAQDVTEPAQPDMGNPISDPIAKRMEALVRAFDAQGHNIEIGSPLWALSVEASAIVALLPEPVDADLLEVRRIVADALPHGMRADILSGAQDHTASIQAPLACLKAGRALERDSREG